MSDRKSTRRQVIRTAAIGAAGMALSRARGPALGVVGANDRIRVGIIGPGDRGSGLIDDFFGCKERYNAELVAVCDLWNRRREAGKAKIQHKNGADAGKSGPDVAMFRNTEELYDAKAVDAVIIATPDFSHAAVCAEAVRAGMDVYVEKPLAHTLEDAKAVRAACKDTGKIVQVGTDRRSDGHYIGAANFVRSGKFGKINNVEMFWNVNDPKRWRREDVVPLLKEKDTDWKRYQLKLPPQKFDPRKYLEFRLFWPYSSGLPDQWMSHQIDTVAMIAGDPYPKSCVASGGIYQWHDGRENPDTFAAIFEYPSGFQVRYTARQTNDFGGTKELYFSNQGMIDLDAGEVLPDGGIGREKGGVGNRLEKQKLPSEGGMDHMANWLQSVRERKQPNAHIEAGYSHSVALSMALVALRTGKRVTFNAETHEIA